MNDKRRSSVPGRKTIEEIKADGLTLDLRAVGGGGFEAICEDDFYRLKTRGVCSPRREQQDFMVRVRVPAGALSADQADRLALLADTYARGWCHLSTRQNVELHMVQVEDTPSVLDGLDGVGLSTRSACGDTIRNLAVCDCAGVCATSVLDPRPWARLFHHHFQAWADYYDTRLPRKVNVYLADCDACADEALLNDVSLVGVRDPSSGRAGFRLYAGGGQGGQQPRLGGMLCDWLEPGRALAATRAVLQVLIDYGERKVRARAKLKFLIEQRGWDWFLEQFQIALEVELQRIGEPLAEPGFEVGELPEPAAFRDCRLPQGVVPIPRSPGHFRLSIRVPLGEVSADKLRGLAALARAHADGMLWLTKRQNLELRFVPGSRVNRLVAAVRGLGLESGETGGVRDVMACVGQEYCPIGLTSTQSVSADVIEWFETTPGSPAVRDLRINLSACPNSCGQHHIGDIGLSGVRLPERDGGGPGYQLSVGGRPGTQAQFGAGIGRVRQSEAARAAIAVTHTFDDLRNPGENFSAFAQRLGPDGLRHELESRLGPGVLLSPGG
jgi:sulfite reductase beta subunit-like hemoprotein